MCQIGLHVTYLYCGYYILYNNPEIKMENGWFYLHSKFPIFSEIPGLFPKVPGFFFPAFKNCVFFAALPSSILQDSTSKAELEKTKKKKKEKKQYK